tara:strand:- start:1442 stop:2131 length:690 start_codon:yes stop_codon:yes gene_type:complete
MPNFKKNTSSFMMKPTGMGQQGYAMNGSDPKKKKPIISKTTQGEIRQAPSKATQLFRKIKNTPAGTPGAIGFAKKIVQFGAVLAPVPALGKVKAVKKIGTAFSNAAKQYRSKAGVGGSNIGSAAKQIKSAISGSNIVIGNTISAAKQVQKFGFKKTKALRKQGITSTKDLRYADKSWTAPKINANVKKVPVVGQPGKKVSVPKSSKTKQVSYVNPRISMTKAQRDKAGY